MTHSNKEQELNIPQHIAIIPDGNRRWARDKGLPDYMGHVKGAENFETLCDYAREKGVKCMTLWAFSTENWKRSENEIEKLFELVRGKTDHYKKLCTKKKMRFIHIGRKDRFPEDILQNLKETEELTRDYADFTIALAADYGGHDELVRTFQKLKANNLEITPENIENNLDTAGLPKLDLIIRPGGELRFSGFMPWQSEYAEYYFTPVYFPAFDSTELQKAIDSFAQRERRFGGNSAKKK